MPTLFTDPRSGGIKKKSDVNVLPIVRETWEEVRNDRIPDIDWLIAGYDGASKSDITVLLQGGGGMSSCANALPTAMPVFGGVRLSSGRFVTFFYADQDTSVMKKGRASMHKNGVLNVLEGSDTEIDIKPGMTEHGESQSPSQSPMPMSSPPVFDNRGNIESNSPVSTSTGTPSEQWQLHLDQPRKYKNSEKRNIYNIQRKIKFIDINKVPDSTVINQTNIEIKENVETPLEAPRSNSSRPRTPITITLEKEPFDKSSPAENECYEPMVPCVPYSDLKKVNDTAQLPQGVDPLNKEASLSDEEFIDVFGMDKQTFYNLPMWKRTSQKKSKLLF